MPSSTSVNTPDNSLWEAMCWQPSTQQIEQFVVLQKQLNYFNSQVNLTRLLQGEDYWIGQVFDSLWPIQNELKTPHKLRNCIDVGTGCGFPGLAVAISLPGAQLTLVDATSKKTSVLKKIITEIGLTSRVHILTERIEITGQNVSYRGKFDLAMARAVAEAPVAAEYLIPLLKLNGEAFLYRGKWNQLDEKNLLQALSSLKGQIKKVQHLKLPSNRGTRHMIRLGAKSVCPKTYPRPVGIPTKKPLGVME